MQKILIRNLTVKYGNKIILDNLNFFVNNGDFIVILGKSGAGKSTLLNSINKFVKFTGKVIIDNKDIGKLSTKNMKKIRRKTGIIFQDYNVFNNLNVLENTMLPFLSRKNIFQTLLNVYTKNEYKKAIMSLHKVGLSDKDIYRKTKYLSGGQKQRLAIARMLCQEPDLILADEPISSLDIKNSEEIMTLFSNLNKNRKITIIMSLHDVKIAKKYSDKIIGIKEGKIIFYKNTEEVTNDEIEDLYV